MLSCESTFSAQCSCTGHPILRHKLAGNLLICGLLHGNYEHRTDGFIVLIVFDRNGSLLRFVLLNQIIFIELHSAQCQTRLLMQIIVVYLCCVY